MWSAVWDILLELSPWLLLGTLVSAVLHVALPEGFVRKQLSGYGGVAKAVGLGVPLPLCSCGVIPAGIGLKRDGASDGAAVGFLISTPQTGVDSILVSASFLGWPFALFKVGAAFATGLAGGWLTEAAGGEPVQVQGQSAGHGHHGSVLHEMWEHADDVLQSIWRWLVFGVLASAAITTFAPDDLFAHPVLAGTLVAPLLALVISLPLYVCATASVPIAAALIETGMPTGAALVFLMAGPATNVATIGAVKEAFGLQVLGIYLGTVVVGSLGLGLAYDALFATTTTALHAHEHATWWGVASAVVLIALLARYAVLDAIAALRPGVDTMSKTPVYTLDVEGLNCNGCVNKLDGALRELDGVESVEVQLTPGKAVVQGVIDEARIRQAIVDAGFKPA